MRLGSLLLGLALAGCSPGEIGLHVDLKTDLLPSVEFDRVRTRIESVEGAQRLGDATRPARRDEGVRYVGGVRVAELTVPAGAVQITVELLDRNGQVIVSRRVLQHMSVTTAVTVVIARSCVGAMCPGPGDDPAATECAGRRCVPPECVTGDEPGCARECTVNADCPAPAAACAQAVCADGACFAAPDTTSCGAGMYCHTELGCLAEPGDGGAPDAGVSDAGPVCGDCDDENPCTDDACVDGVCTHTNNTASCDDGIFCNGRDSCEDGACTVHAGSPCVGATVCSEADGTCTGCLTDNDCPAETQTSWGACTSGHSCSTSGTRSRDVTRWACEAGVCVSNTSAESQSCTRTADASDCPATTRGTWGSCGGFSDTCDETGTRSRSVTTYACAAGACAPSTSAEVEPCTRSRTGVMCGDDVVTLGTCGGFSGTCDETGTRSRTVTSYACAGGSCVASTTSGSQACTRDRTGVSCGDDVVTFGTCGGFSDMCDQTGTRSRTVTSYSCSGGACTSSMSTTSVSCTRVTDGMTGCAPTTYGPWVCGGFTSTCDQTGTETRTVTNHVCGGGTCNPVSAPPQTGGSCTRSTQGTPCSTFLDFPCHTGAFCQSGFCRAADNCGAGEICCEHGCLQQCR